MKVDQFLNQPGSWLAREQDPGIVVSSRVRLARNLQEFSFPGWCRDGECSEVWDRALGVLPKLKTLPDALSSEIDTLSKLDRQILFERHLISRDHMDRENGGGVMVSPDESISIMVNEEDHLRLQAIHPGLTLRQAWEEINAIDDELGEELDFAFSPTLGYLTACPSNVGTGMRASVMLHLPALVLMEEINPIMKGMGKIGLAVRGLWGEGTEATGNMFQVSNQITLGEKEEDIIHNLEQIVSELVTHEQNARTRLMEQRDTLVRDHVGRSMGILSNTWILSSKEALDLMSGLRLGIDLGILKTLNWAKLNDLLILTQPGHLQKIEGRRLKAQERDEARAALVRERVVKASKPRRKPRNT